MGRAAAGKKPRQADGKRANKSGAAGGTARKTGRKSGARRGSEPRLSAAERKAALRARSGVRRPGTEGLVLTAYPIGKARKSLKGISIYMHPLAKDVLDRIAREQDRSVQELGLEALNLLFRHYGERPIA